MPQSYEMSPEISMVWNMLLSRKLATEDQLNEVFEESLRSGRRFIKILYDYEIIFEDDLLTMVAEELGTQFVTLKSKDIDPELIPRITTDMARTYGIVPVMEDEETITFVCENPFDAQLVDELHFIVNKDCRLLVGRPKEVNELIDTFYPETGGGVTDAIKGMIEEHEANIDQYSIMSDDELEQAGNDAPIVRFVNLILQQAIRDKASDIHFEPFGDEFRIRYRIDGSLYEMAPPPKQLAIPVISRIKVMSNLNISEKRVPQDGRIELRINKKPVDLRVSTLPTRYGESVVLRILDRSVVNLSLDSLGMNDYVKGTIRSIICRPNGIFVVTGPTGSGKTTTLYSGLREINTPEDKLLTAEDPVEYNIDGLVQCPMHEAVGMTFAKALRAFLRQDPDRIMVGEIRDVETASIAIQASLTGHFVMSTLHTNDAAGAVTRLIDMGIEPFLISSTLNGVLAQRLVRRICTNCKTSYVPSDGELEALGMTREELGDRLFYRGSGCDICNGSGYKGRCGIYEMLLISNEIQVMINERRTAQEIKDHAVKHGMTTLRRDGINHVLNGVTTASEVIQYTIA